MDYNSIKKGLEEALDYSIVVNKMDKDNLLNLLINKERVVVRFIKKDGSTRMMNCTLNPDVIPEIVGTSAPRPEHLITVYDIDNDGWRSINLENGVDIVEVYE